MNLNLSVLPNKNGNNLKIGIVLSRFNKSVGQVCFKSCLRELSHLGVSINNIIYISVPGALELGAALSWIAERLKPNALIALGAVIRGNTYHFQIVSNEMARAITEVTFRTGIPIANGVLTTETKKQAESRAERKGRDCANVAVEMANLAFALKSGELKTRGKNLDMR